MLLLIVIWQNSWNKDDFGEAIVRITWLGINADHVLKAPPAKLMTHFLNKSCCCIYYWKLYNRLMPSILVCFVHQSILEEFFFYNNQDTMIIKTCLLLNYNKLKFKTLKIYKKINIDKLLNKKYFTY